MINNVNEHFVVRAVMLNQPGFIPRIHRREGRRVGAVRDYCLFIRGLSFGEFSGCAYLRNDGNPLSLFFTPSHHERDWLPRRKGERDGDTFGWWHYLRSCD